MPATKNVLIIICKKGTAVKTETKFSQANRDPNKELLEFNISSVGFNADASIHIKGNMNKKPSKTRRVTEIILPIEIFCRVLFVLLIIIDPFLLSDKLERGY